MNMMNVMAQGAEEEKGENARMSSFIGAIAVGDLVKSTLGPKGMDKILQSQSKFGQDGDVEVTNDGATILKSIGIDNPAAKILIDISKVQDQEVGDGTTSVCVFAAELLRQAEKLIDQKIHPQTVISGWRKATKVAQEELIGFAVDHSADKKEFREDLLNIARTTLSSKILQQSKDYFSELAVDAVLRLGGSTNLGSIAIIQKLGGQLRDSYLDQGFIIDKKFGLNMPRRVENAKILIANTAMDKDAIKVSGTRVRVDAVAKVAEIEEAEKAKMKKKVDSILKTGTTLFINRQLVYNYPESLFAQAGVSMIEHADFAGVERLALVTGGEIASSFLEPEGIRLGHADLVEEIIIGEDRLIRFSGVPNSEACTIVLRGATKNILQESERSLHDALSVLSQTVKEPRIVYGGGCTEMMMACRVDELANRTEGKESLAIAAFATALRQMPTIIADNGGYDSSELVANLRAAHIKGKKYAGLNMNEGKIGDMKEMGITESFKLKQQVLLSASEAAEMILRVDNIIRMAPRQRGSDDCCH